MKKATFTLIALIGLVSIIVVPETLSWAFFIDYPLRLIVLAWAANNLCKLDRQRA